MGNWKNLETTIKDGSVLISSLGVTIGEAETMFAARPKMLLNSTPCLSVTLGRNEPHAGRGCQWRTGIAIIAYISNHLHQIPPARNVLNGLILSTGSQERRPVMIIIDLFDILTFSILIILLVIIIIQYIIFKIKGK